jgi:hypothetical protein
MEKADWQMTTIHILRVSLRPRIYRDIEIRSSASLYDLAESIVRAYKFDFDYAFGFFGNLTGNIFQSPIQYELFVDIDIGSSSKSVKRTKVGQAFPTVGSKMTFLFDYGDEWHFKVEVIGIGKLEPKARYPRIIKTVGDAPRQYGEPEDDEECWPNATIAQRARPTRSAILSNGLANHRFQLREMDVDTRPFLP